MNTTARHLDLAGGRIVPDPTDRPSTGSWRTGRRPALDLGQCVHCLLCWVYCPDVAIKTEDTRVTAIDLELCKGCEICVTVCPVRALTMVEETGGEHGGS
jgi:2-oxoacid:acceptor oxidoreductase delta subunit (pyruvate/2-ketoisovalerate family)